MICGSSWKTRKLDEEVDPSQHHSLNTFISSDIFNPISRDGYLCFTVFKFTVFVPVQLILLYYYCKKTKPFLHNRKCQW